MSFRILILGLAVGICALWPQGLVLCMGNDDHVELESAGTPCCPAQHQNDDRDDDRDDAPAGDCDDCRDHESPELTSVIPAPALPAPVVAIHSGLPAATPTSPAGDPAPSAAPDDLRTVILVV